MLTALRIREFGTIDAAAVEFGSGLNVLTGDDAAARLLAVGALGAAVGGPVPADAVRPRATAALEARFTLSGDSAASRWLRAQGIEDREVVLTREISADGRSRARINGKEVAVEVMRELGDLLVEIAGPGNSRLLRPTAQLDLLDAFGGPALETLRIDIGGRLRALAALRAEQNTLKEVERDRLRQIETLTQQVREIDAAAPEPGEEEALTARRARLLNAEKLAAAARTGLAALTDAEGQSPADPFGRARAALRDVAAVLPQIAAMGSRHLMVEKETTGGRSRMQVRLLDSKDRVQEIARMLSGRMPAAIAREYAAELLGRARRTMGNVAPREAGGGTS